MLIQFQIEYKTYYGQVVMLCGTHPRLGGGDRNLAVLMQYENGSDGIWSVTIQLDDPAEFSYRYFIRNSHEGSEIEEWGEDRVFCLTGKNVASVALIDHWRPASDPEFALFSSAFTRSILRPVVVDIPQTASKSKGKKSVLVQFSPLASRVCPGHRLAVTGSSSSLGGWDEGKALPLSNPGHPSWSVEASVPLTDFPLTYKYLMQDENGKTLFWEKSPDRQLSLPEEIPQRMEVRDERFVFPGNHWRGAGIAIPVFSLRRECGYGVGEFPDIRMLVDWACETGIRMIQILPVNDTVARHTWKDSYPYAAISVFALHPIYVSLPAIGQLSSKITGRVIEEQGKYLNSLPRIDYEAVMALKSRFFKLIFDQVKVSFLKEPGFLEFFDANSHWLRPYAAFSYLRDLFNTPDFTRWNGFTGLTDEILDDLTNPSAPHYDDIAIHYFIQYHAHRQLLDAASYARSRGVVLKGDIPIGIYRNSVDAWVSPRLYNMDAQAGAPPDDFSVIGQNWRFPTYNWEAMAADDFSWWQQRLRQMSVYFDAFRIDHILGFFRIWEIPARQVQGLMGYFNPSLPFSKDELLSRGLFFDEERFCKPYIRERWLKELFGQETDYVKNTFLESYAPGCYRLLPDYDTQQKVEERLTPSEDAGAEERNRLTIIRNGLFSLISEVLFLEAPDSGGSAWFPRSSFHSSHSFKELDAHTQQLLDSLYVEYFYRRNEEFWKGKALHKLPAIKKATDMLLCGEDLGMVPACVPHVMNDLGILSLEVQRMPKNPQLEFGLPHTYPYLSVATPSSHDTSTIRGWWEEDPARTQKFYHQVLNLPGFAPRTCSPDIVYLIIRQHLHSPSMWAVFPMQDLLGTDERLRYDDPFAERINQPGNPEHYWRYRLHLSLEELMKQEEFNRKIRTMVNESGRLQIY